MIKKIFKKIDTNLDTDFTKPYEPIPKNFANRLGVILGAGTIIMIYAISYAIKTKVDMPTATMAGLTTYLFVYAVSKTME